MRKRQSVTEHFSSLEDSVSQKSQLIESNFQDLESRSQKSLDARENSIPEHESAAAARIGEQKEAAMA